MSRRRPPLVRSLAAALALAALPACGDAAGTPPSSGQRPTGEVVVFAAASLTDAFEAIADDVEARHPDLDVVLNLAGSQQLAGQLLDGAPADVFASADPGQMAAVSDAGLTAAAAVPFATNTLAVAVEPGNPRSIGGLADLADDDLILVLADAAVPAGRYADAALAAAGVSVRPDSREPDVRAALSKVVLGEADAAVVYRSDVVAAGDDVDGVPVPAAEQVTATYPVAVLADAPNPAGAAAVVEAVTSSHGRALLADHGFGVP